MRWVALGLALIGSVGCASHGPQRTLDAYAAALERGDAGALLELSDPATRAALDRAEVKRFLRKNPATARRAAEALRGGVDAITERATVVTSSGTVLELVRYDGAWHVARGPMPLPRLDTPEHALRTFFFAARGHLSLLRQTIPNAHRERFASDARLGRHLFAQQARIAAARAALAPVRPGSARIDDATAVIPWGPGRAVRLVKEDGTWRVADLE